MAFRGAWLTAKDLSERQVDQLCNRTFGMQRELAAWLCDTTGRFLNIIKPWTHVWLSFTNWALRWCRQNSIETLAFLARDALPFFIAAAAQEHGLQLHLVHVSRKTDPDAHTVNPILRQPSVALIDSGCNGTCINDLRQRRSVLTGGSGHEGLATLLYYSRNPQLFGYMNYVMGQDMLASPEAMHRAAEFVIYSGDVLETLPKPYQYHARGRSMVEPSDLLSFTISIAALSDIAGMAKASTFLDADPLIDASDQVRLLYKAYQLSRHRSELHSDFPFDPPAPKVAPAPGALAGLNFLEIPPQSHIFGTALDLFRQSLMLGAVCEMLLPASAMLRFLTSRQKGPGEYLEAGEDEPTMEALRWAAEISAILSAEPLAPAPFVDQCRRPDGAFAMTATDPEPSRAAGYYAVRALVLSGLRAGIPDALARWFVSELATPGLPATCDIDEMFYVLRALEQMDAVGLLAPRVSGSLVDFLQSCRAGDGGYAGAPGRAPDTEHTYCAVCSLSLLGHPLGAGDSRVTAAWLRSRFATPSGLATLTAADDTPRLAASYWGYRAGEVLDAIVWTDRLGPAVQSLGKPEGGFGATEHATLWESYCALRLLSRLASAPRGTGL